MVWDNLYEIIEIYIKNLELIVVLGFRSDQYHSSYLMTVSTQKGIRFIWVVEAGVIFWIYFLLNQNGYDI